MKKFASFCNCLAAIAIIINSSTNEIKMIPFDIEITARILFRIAEKIDSGLLSY